MNPQQSRGIAPIAVPITAAARLVGVSRTRIFQAVRNQELTARKAGKTTLIGVNELKRWFNSLPTRGASTNGSNLRTGGSRSASTAVTPPQGSATATTRTRSRGRNRPP